MALENERKEQIAARVKEAMEAAKTELEREDKARNMILPEHYSTILKHPNLSAEGCYSEIDFEIEARFKTCDTYVKGREIYRQAMYHSVRNEIETKAADLKAQVKKISKDYRTLSRAARICTNPEAKKVIEEKAKALKEAEPVKNYNQLITALESYAGNGAFHMDGASVAALESIGHITDGSTLNIAQTYYERPEQLKVDFRSMDSFFEQFKYTHPEAKEKTAEELGKLFPSYDLFEKTVLQYGKDALEDTLNSSFPTMDERLDLIMINGQTLREMVAETDKIEGRKPEEVRTPEELNAVSCNILTAALKSEARVEAFMMSDKNQEYRKYYDEPVPMVGTKPKERVTMNFWERFMSKFGFYKEKVEALKEQQAMDQKMEECKKRVMAKMHEENTHGKVRVLFDPPMTKETKERLKITREIAKQNCDSFVRDIRALEEMNGIKDALTFSFFPEEAKARKGVTITGKVDVLARDKALYTSVTMMLQRNIPLEEILDITKHKELRVQIGKELKEKFPTMTADEYDDLHMSGLILQAESMEKYAKKMSKEIKSQADLDKKMPELFKSTICAQVLSMDNFMNKERVYQKYGGQEKVQAIKDKIDEVGNIYTINDLQKTTIEKYYKVLRGKEVNLQAIMMEKMQKAGILMGLQSKHPSFNPQIKSNDNLMYSALLSFHPEVMKMKEKVNNLDKDFLNDLLATGGDKYAHLEIDIFEKPAQNLTPIGPYSAKELTFGIDCVINGKGIAEFDVPRKQLNKQEEPEMDAEPFEL